MSLEESYEVRQYRQRLRDAKRYQGIEMKGKRAMTTICYCDGGCLGNGTQNATAYGSYKIGAMPVQRITHHEQAHTNNEGEYLTLIATLEAIKASEIKEALIRCDSALVVNQVVGTWRVKEPRLMPLRDQAKRLIAETGAAMEWVKRDEIEAVLGH